MVFSALMLRPAVGDELQKRQWDVAWQRPPVAARKLHCRKEIWQMLEPAAKTFATRCCSLQSAKALVHAIR